MHARLDLACDLFGGAATALSGGQLAVRLVNGDLLAHQEIVVQNCHHAARELAIAVEARAQEDGLWAEPAGQGRRHGAVDAVTARGVVGGADDAAPVGIAADDHRPADERWIVQLLNGGEEAVQVAVHHAPDWDVVVWQRDHNAFPFISTGISAYYIERMYILHRGNGATFRVMRYLSVAPL